VVLSPSSEKLPFRIKSVEKKKKGSGQKSGKLKEGLNNEQ
jgi:hypothetical protein